MDREDYLDIRGISLEDSWDVVLWIMVSTEHIEEASLDKGKNSQLYK